MIFNLYGFSLYERRIVGFGTTNLTIAGQAVGVFFVSLLKTGNILIDIHTNDLNLCCVFPLLSENCKFRCNESCKF